MSSSKMDNLLPTKPAKALFAYTICLMNLIPIIKAADPSFYQLDCPNNTTYEPDSTYQTNLNTLFSVLKSNSTVTNGFYNFTAGTSPPNIAYGLFLCRGDVSAAVCQDCVFYASADIVKRCPASKRATIWYDECMLRYSNQSIFSVPEIGGRVMYNFQNVTNVTRLNEVLGEIMDDIANRASSDNSGKKFATAEANYSLLQPVYGLAQCTPDLSDSQCNTCLRNCISQFPSCCNAKKGARILFQSCIVIYEMFPFYDASFGAAPPPPSPVLPPPPSPPPTTTRRSRGKGGIPLQVIIAIVVAIGVAITLFIASFCFLTRRVKKKDNSTKENQIGDDMPTVESLQYDLGIVQDATNNFSDDNIIGKGGFGQVYKGLLPDGQEVAVKRLSQTSRQGAQEFKNEVRLVAKLQHKNLARLLGFCLEGEEKILIYEFVPNKSLDYFLFDPQEQAKLDWSRRYKIIGGVARGMLYLHEDSRLTIIHRDLKASNILLDDDMNAKVSDFGTARIFGVDQTHGSTHQIIGTRGYMSPEYIMRGKFSAKSDVYSFGVLILEIISGKKNIGQLDGVADLLSYAWEHWSKGTPLDFMDPTLEGSYSKNEVTRCIHIGLLCVQDDPATRPSMAMIVLMLNSHFTALSLPQQPAFLDRSRTGSYTFENIESDQSTSKSIQLSVNEASITELDPR